MRFLYHKQRCSTISWTLLDEWSACCRDLYLTTHNTHNRQTSMHPVGFEPTISAIERPQTYDLDRAATGTGGERMTSDFVNLGLILKFVCVSVRVRSCVLMRVLNAACLCVYMLRLRPTLEKKYRSLVKFKTSVDCVHGGRIYWLNNYQF